MLPAFVGNNGVDRRAPTGSVDAVYRVLPMLDFLATVDIVPPADQFGAVPFERNHHTNPYFAPETGLTYEGGVRVHVADAN